MSSTVEVLDLLRGYSCSQTIPANTRLFQQGDSLRDIYLLEKGLIKLTLLEANGQEVIVELRLPGCLLGAASTLANAPAPLSALTGTQSEVARLLVKDFLALIQTNAQLAHNLLIFISQQKAEQSVRQSNQKAFPARARLIQLLLWLSPQYGVEKNGEMRLASPLSKQEMAQYVGIQPQSLSAILRDLKRDGLLTEEKGWIIFRDIERLRYEAEMGERANGPSRLSKRER